jgi:hypothetical protein
MLSGSHVRRVLEKHNIRTPTHGSPARPVRYVFSATKYSHILSRHGGNDVYGLLIWRGRVRTDQRWDEGVGAGGGQLGSNARARRSLDVASLVSFKRGPARPETTQDGGGSQPEERRRSLGSPAAEETRYGGFLGTYTRTHHLLRHGDSIPVLYQPLP